MSKNFKIPSVSDYCKNKDNVIIMLVIPFCIKRPVLGKRI